MNPQEANALQAQIADLAKQQSGLIEIIKATTAAIVAAIENSRKSKILRAEVVHDSERLKFSGNAKKIIIAVNDGCDPIDQFIDFNTLKVGANGTDYSSLGTDSILNILFRNVPRNQRNLDGFNATSDGNSGLIFPNMYFRGYVNGNDRAFESIETNFTDIDIGVHYIPATILILGDL